jgi:phosphatidylglycerophosphate synthase
MDEGLAALRALPLIELVPLIGIPLYWIGGFIIFLTRCALWGMPRTERIGRTNSRMMPRVVLEYGYWMLRPPVVVAIRFGLTPNALTVLGLVAAALAGVLFGLGHFGAAGWILALSAACDALDGIVARETGVSSDRGEYFDSVIDRYADFAPMVGLAWYYQGALGPTLIIALCTIGSQVMGYAKAKGEAVGIDPKVGWMQRHERCVYLLSAAVLSPIVSAFLEPGAAHPTYPLMLVAVLLVAVLTNASTVARAAFVMQRMPAPPPPSSRPAASAEVEPERAEPSQPDGQHLSGMV